MHTGTYGFEALVCVDVDLVDVVLRCFISQETRKLLILQFDKILSIPTGPKMNI